MGVGTRNPCNVKERSSQGYKPTATMLFIGSSRTVMPARLTHALETATAYFALHHFGLSFRLLQHVCPSFDIPFSDRLSYEFLKLGILVTTSSKDVAVFMPSRLRGLATD